MVHKLALICSAASTEFSRFVLPANCNESSYVGPSRQPFIEIVDSCVECLEFRVDLYIASKTIELYGVEAHCLLIMTSGMYK